MKLRTLLMVLGSISAGFTAAVFICKSGQLPRIGSGIIHLQNGDSLVAIAGRTTISIIAMDDDSRLPAQVTLTTLIDGSVDSTWEFFPDSHIRRTISIPDPKVPGEFIELIDSNGDGTFESILPTVR